MPNLLLVGGPSPGRIKTIVLSRGGGRETA